MGPDEFNTKQTWVLSSDSAVNNLPDNAGDTREAGLMPGLGRSPGVGNGNLLQYPFFFFFPSITGEIYFLFLLFKFILIGG